MPSKTLQLKSFRRVRRLGTLGLAICAGIAFSAVTTRARAEVSFALAWRKDARGPACVDEATLREAVERRLDRRPFVDRAGADIVIEAEENVVSRDTFRARVTERDRHGVLRGERLLEAQSCPSLRRAAALLVTLIIEPHLRGERAEGAATEPTAEPRAGTEAPQAVEPGAATEAPQAVEPRAATEAPRPVEPRAGTEAPRAPRSPSSESAPAPSLPPFFLSIGLGVGTTVGVLPSASATVFAVARLASPSSRLRLDWWGGYSLPQHLRREADVAGHFAAVEQRVRLCLGVVRVSSHELETCAGLMGGAILPTTIGIGRGQDRLRPLMGPTLAVAFEKEAGPFSGRVEVGAIYSLRQYDFSYLDQTSERKSFYSTSALLFFVTLSGVGEIR